MKKIFSSLRNRIFLTFGMFFLAVMLFLLFIVQNFSVQYFSSLAVSSNRRELAASTDNLESRFQHVMDYSISVSINDTVIETAKKNPDLPQSETVQYELRKKLNTTISTIIGLSPNIDMWDIMTLEGDYFQAGGYDLTGLQDFSPEIIFACHEETIGARVSGPYYYLPERKNAKNRGKYYFIVSKPIVSLNTREVYGYVLFFIEDAMVSSVFENYRPQESEGVFYIIDEANKILLSAKKEEIGTLLGDTVPLLASSRNYEELEARGYLIAEDQMQYQMVYCSTKMQDMQWRLIYAIPLQELMEEQRIFEQVFLAVMVLVTAVFFLLAWWNSHKIAIPILRLSNTMQHVVQDAYATTPVPKASEEIRILYQGYNDLVIQTQELLQTIYEEEQEKRDYQFRLVQEQIKPHFLYNTLEMIKSMIDLGIYEEAGKAISSMATFYRHSLSRGSDIISIGSELEMIKQYLYIEKLRHMEYFDYEIQEDENAKEYMIPKMTLQPILENAIVHGASSDGKVCTVKVTVIAKEHTVCFCVKDDGNGIEAQRLKELNEALDNSQVTEEDSFGLKSINRRIRLLFGSEYGMKLQSEPGKGTKVYLEIPKRKKVTEHVSEIFGEK